MAKFELISKYKNNFSLIPKRKTKESAGYDFVVAEDTVIRPFNEMTVNILNDLIANKHSEGYTLDEIAAITKKTGAKPTLVPTGVKAKLDPGTYLELSVRSSCPLKHWLVMANGVGIIDGDYYDNPDNEGHIYFQIINFSPVPILLKKGDCIGQGIIKPYLKTENDKADNVRKGGFGSTSSKNKNVVKNNE